jgi:hypothetical protein
LARAALITSKYGDAHQMSLQIVSTSSAERLENENGSRSAARSAGTLIARKSSRDFISFFMRRARSGSPSG